MTFFDHASDIDARDSSFTDVGRDQINITYNVYNLVSAPERGPVFHRPGPVPPLQISHSEPSSQTIVLRPTFRSAPSLARHIAARLIVEIVQSLMTSDTDQFHDLKEDLNTLQQMLDLTALAIDAFQCIPLGRILASTIGNETEECIGVLREFLSEIRAFQQVPRSTRINLPWNRVGSGCKSGEIRIWRERLSTCQKSLGECLKVLYSASSNEFGSGVRAGSIFPQDIIRLLRHGPPSLRHIQVNRIIVVDHLGRNIPVPAIFCSAWEDFRTFISELCRNTAGHRFIESGDFMILHNNKVIDPLEFADSVSSGMTIEMSIVIRQNAYEDRGKKCPRCGHVHNMSIIRDDDWIEWEVPSGSTVIVN